MINKVLATILSVAAILVGCSSSTNSIEPNQSLVSSGKDGFIQGGNGAIKTEKVLTTNVKNRCTNQSVRMTLEFKIIETSNDENDRVHDGRHVVMNGYGVMLDGTEWYIHTTSNTIVNSDGDGYPYTENMVTNSRLKIKNGDGVEYKLSVRYHITYNANGDVTIEIDETDLDCDT